MLFTGIYTILQILLLFNSLQAGSFVIFLLFLSYSLLHASSKLDPTQYTDVPDFLRGFCEIVTIVMAVFYICEEIHQMKMWVIIATYSYR